MSPSQHRICFFFKLLSLGLANHPSNTWVLPLQLWLGSQTLLMEIWPLATGGNLVYSCKSNLPCANVYLVRVEDSYKWDHVILKGLRLGGRSSGLCEREKRVGEVRLEGDSVWDPSFLRFACQKGLKYRNKAETISPRPFFSGRGLVRTESGCVQTSLEFSSWKFAYKYHQVSNDIICHLTFI